MRATEYLDMIENGFNPERELRMTHLDSKNPQIRELIKAKRREIKKIDNYTQ